MNWKKIVPAILAVGVMSTAGLAGAQGTGGSTGTYEGTERSSTEMGQMGQMGQQQTVTATVKEVDRTNNKVTLEANLDPSAQVERNGNPSSLENIQPGDSVRASFDPTTGEITNLDVQPSGSSQQQKQGQQGSQSGSQSGMEGSSGSMDGGY